MGSGGVAVAVEESLDDDDEEGTGVDKRSEDVGTTFSFSTTFGGGGDGSTSFSGNAGGVSAAGDVGGGVDVDGAVPFGVKLAGVGAGDGGADVFFPGPGFRKDSVDFFGVTTFFGANDDAAPDGERLTTGEFAGTTAPAENDVCIAGDRGLRAAAAGLNFEESDTGNDGARFTGVAPAPAFLVVVFVDLVLPVLLATELTEAVDTFLLRSLTGEPAADLPPAVRTLTVDAADVLLERATGVDKPPVLAVR